MDKQLIQEAQRQANIDLYNRLVKKTLAKNIYDIDNLIDYIEKTSGPITLGYKGRSVIIGFASDPADMRSRVIDLLQDVLVDNKIALADLVGHSISSSTVDPEVFLKPHVRQHKSYDQHGNPIVEDDNE